MNGIEYVSSSLASNGFEEETRDPMLISKSSFSIGHGEEGIEGLLIFYKCYVFCKTCSIDIQSTFSSRFQMQSFNEIELIFVF